MLECLQLLQRIACNSSKTKALPVLTPAVKDVTVLLVASSGTVSPLSVVISASLIVVSVVGQRVLC